MPIEANGIIPVAQSDVANIPSIAMVIPDFEGQAILRIFANSTQQEIGCFSAVVTNGNTFSQPAAVGTVLGIFTIIAIVASFATAIYGDHIPTVRKHYAHSLSVLVVFAVFHHIFYTGALSMNWPSVLVAFWSNYAWAGGMIYTESMQTSISNFIGANRGNTSHVGAAGSGTLNEGLGGGYDIHQIYGRSLNMAGIMERSKYNLVSRKVEHMLSRRSLVNSSSGFDWYGSPVRAGLPLPGNWSGFAGTLGAESIPASNAFMTGFLWFLILLVIVAGSVAGFKWLLEGLSMIKLIKRDRLAFFRAHWLAYTAQAVLRTFFIGFFMMVFLSMFQFTYNGSGGVVGIAAIVFIIFLVGMLGLAGYACYYRIHFGNYTTEPGRLVVRSNGMIPEFVVYGKNQPLQEGDEKPKGGVPFFYIAHTEVSKTIHDDEDFLKKFGWLAGRFRHTRWWFFAVWLVYEFIRACFYGGASGQAMTQVFGLLVVEIIAFVMIVIMRPFEGQRLNAIVVYCLGFSKVTTVALSAAFDVSFNLARIPTTVIGVVIIVIQGILTIILLIAIIVGAISTYFSLTRNKETIRPRRWIPLRERYFRHIDQVATDLPPLPPSPEPIPEEPKHTGPYFSVNSVKRMAKIEDEDPEFVKSTSPSANQSRASLPLAGGAESPVGPMMTRGSRTMSMASNMSYTSLPYAARVHRASWSTRDFEQFHDNERLGMRNSTAGSDARLISSRPSSGYELSTPKRSRPMADGEDYSTPSPVAGGLNTPRTRSMSNRPKLNTLVSEENVPTMPGKGKEADKGGVSPIWPLKE